MSDLYKFVPTDAGIIEKQIFDDFSLYSGKNLSAADPLRLLIKWFSAQFSLLASNINFSANMNIPSYAQGDFLDNLASLFWDLHRLPSANSIVTLTFSISEPQTSAVAIVAGTRCTNGEFVFTVNKTAFVPAGETQINVPAICSSPGTASNNILPGEIIICLDKFLYFQSVTNVSSPSGGADVESDENFYKRMQSAMASYSNAGSVQSYIFFAKSASSAISDVKVITPSAGVVQIFVLLENGEIPSQEILDLVYSTCNSEKVRPLTDNLQVLPPTTTTYNILLTYFISPSSSDFSLTIQQNVQSAVTDFIAWQCEFLGQYVNPSKLTQMIMDVSGVSSVEISSPDFISVPENSVAKIGSVNVVFGGVKS